MRQQDTSSIIDGVLLSMNHESGNAINIATIRKSMPVDDLAQLALRGCAYWVKEPVPEKGILLPNTVIVGSGRCTSHAILNNKTYELLKGHWIDAYENPNIEQGFYTFSGYFVTRSIAMWCALHIEKGLKPGWSKRSAFSDLQSDGVVWEAHEADWKAYQKTTQQNQ